MTAGPNMVRTYDIPILHPLTHGYEQGGKSTYIRQVRGSFPFELP
jgi:hypothetical protein